MLNERELKKITANKIIMDALNNLKKKKGSPYIKPTSSIGEQLIENIRNSIEAAKRKRRWTD